MDKLKKKIKMTVAKPDENCFEEVRQMYNEWMNLLDELLFVPGHQVPPTFLRPHCSLG